MTTIQRAHRLGRFLSRLFFIISIISAVMSASLLILHLCGLDSTAFVSAVIEKTGKSPDALYGISIVLLIYSLSEVLVSHKAASYFSLELELGTPFTTSGAAKLFRLGILAIVTSFLSFILSYAAYTLLYGTNTNMFPMKLNATGSVTLGIMFIIISLMMKYGAELERRQ